MRPLDARGREQALGLVDALAEFPIERIVSSPALRCVGTVEPLASARGVDVEPLEDLWEELQAHAGAALVHRLAGRDVAVCGHGGLESALSLEEKWRKGATFVLDDRLALVRVIPARA